MPKPLILKCLRNICVVMNVTIRLGKLKFAKFFKSGEILQISALDGQIRRISRTVRENEMNRLSRSESVPEF